MDAVLLDHRSAKIDHAEYRCALQPTLPARSSVDDRRMYRRKTESFIHAIERLPLSEPFDVDDPSTMNQYGTIVVGSDEVWNLVHPWYGGKRIFYGEGLKTDRLVSYAASFGNYPANWGLSEPYSQLLDRFGVITVRDENSRTLVSAATGRENQLVLDPCLQFAPETNSAGPASSGPVIVYGHNFSEWLSTSVRAWADANGHRLISIGYRNDWVHDHMLDAGPGSFYKLFQNARAVITNFFHGCVFAVRNALPFLCETSPYRWNKVCGLVTSLGCESRLVENERPDPLALELLDEPLECSVFDRLSEMRAASDSILRDALAT
jgi:hypothetical protein